MNNSFKLELLRSPEGALRAELVHVSEPGHTVITIAMTIPNQLGQLSILQAQAEVLRMACSDLEAQSQTLLSIPPAGT